MYYQCEFLDAKLLDKTLHIIDEVLHVVSIDPLGFPILIVTSEEDLLESTEDLIRDLCAHLCVPPLFPLCIFFFSH